LKQQQSKLESREHVLKIDEDNYYGIKQLLPVMDHKFPASLINYILKEYIEAHKNLLIMGTTTVVKNEFAVVTASPSLTSIKE
jgi:hypothetical protein